MHFYRQSFKPECPRGQSLRACTCARWSLQRKVSKRRAFIAVTSISRLPGQKIQKCYLHCLSDYPPAYLLICSGCCPQHQSAPSPPQQMLYVNVTLQQKLRMGGVGGRGVKHVQRPWFWWRRALQEGAGPSRVSRTSGSH